MDEFLNCIGRNDFESCDWVECIHPHLGSRRGKALCKLCMKSRLREMVVVPHMVLVFVVLQHLALPPLHTKSRWESIMPAVALHPHNKHVENNEHRNEASEAAKDAYAHTLPRSPVCVVVDYVRDRQ